jgi:uncharacterized membrane protein YfcA
MGGLAGVTPAAGFPLRGARLEIAFFGTFPQSDGVTKLCIFTCMTAAGYIAGYLVQSFGLMTEIIVSGIGSMVGVYLGWKLAQRIER